LDLKPMQNEFPLNAVHLKMGSIVIISAILEDGSQINKKALLY